MAQLYIAWPDATPNDMRWIVDCRNGSNDVTPTVRMWMCRSNAPWCHWQLLLRRREKKTKFASNAADDQVMCRATFVPICCLFILGKNVIIKLDKCTFFVRIGHAIWVGIDQIRRIGIDSGSVHCSHRILIGSIRRCDVIACKLHVKRLVHGRNVSVQHATVQKPCCLSFVQ